MSKINTGRAAFPRPETLYLDGTVSDVGIAGFDAKVNPARQNPYKHIAPQPARQPLTDDEIWDAVKHCDDNRFAVARAIEAAHGIGSLCGSGMANTAPPCTNLEQDSRAILDAAKKLLKELAVLRDADIEEENWMPVNDADDELRAAIDKVEIKQ